MEYAKISKMIGVYRSTFSQCHGCGIQRILPTAARGFLHDVHKNKDTYLSRGQTEQNVMLLIQRNLPEIAPFWTGRFPRCTRKQIKLDESGQKRHVGIQLNSSHFVEVAGSGGQARGEIKNDGKSRDVVENTYRKNVPQSYDHDVNENRSTYAWQSTIFMKTQPLNPNSSRRNLCC